jgi:drug/metabolite transporter (DMT)-like permease
LAGLVAFVAASRFVVSCRDDLRGTFTVFNPWLLLAGILSSLGQLCYFVALTDIAISRIALITSMEVFVTILLSTVVFRSKEEITRDVVMAAGLGVLGTIFVIVG